ncbi:MAG: aspartyl protease family protein, partial [Phenylobacterium sp.]|nr:aspartyl protease family protein [Phenylobacterium sp.]
MLTRRQMALGLGLGGFSLPPVSALAQSSPMPPPTTGTRIVDPEDAEFNASFDPKLRMVGGVAIDETGPHQFIVDTGANRSVISLELARELELEVAETVTLHGIAGSEEVPTAVVPRFDVAGIVTHNLHMPMLPQRRLGADGLLGLDALASRAVELDFRRGRVRL